MGSLDQAIARKRTTLVVGLGATLVSAAASWIPSVWADEGASVSGASRSLPQLWVLVQRIDAVHAVYYAVLNLWFHVFGVSEFWLRLPSAIMVGVAAALLLRLSLHWLPPRPALVAAVVFSVLPRVTWTGIEGRSSAMSTMLAVGATLLLVLAIRDPRRWGWWVWYSVVIGLGIATHIYLVFLLAAHLASLLWRREGIGVLARWAGGAVVSGLLASPVVLLSARQTGQINAPAISPIRWAADVAVNQFFLGQTPGSIGPTWWRLAWQGAAVLLALAGWLLAARAVWSQRRHLLAPAGHIGWAVPWVLVPPLLVLAWSLLSKNMYHPRYFAFCAPAMAVLIAAGVGEVRRTSRQVACIVLLAALALPVYVSQRGVNAKSGADWSEVAATVAERGSRGDGVYFCVSQARRIAISYPVQFRERTDITLLRSPADDASLGGASRPLADSLGEDSPPVIWTICRTDEAASAADAGTMEAAGYQPVWEWNGTQTRVVEYRRP
jgi:mannosyltransferase